MRHRAKYGLGLAGAEGAVADPAPRTGVPRWLRPLVIVLALAVVVLGGAAVHFTIQKARSLDPLRAAIVRWERHAAANPDDPDALRGLALAYQQAGRYDDAVASYREVLRRAPDDLGARYNLGVVQIASGSPDEGEQTLRLLLADVPDHVLAAKTLGERLINRDEYEEALRVLTPASASRPELADLQYDTGLALEWLGRYEEAAERYQAALRYAPDLQVAIDGLVRVGVTP